MNAVAAQQSNQVVEPCSATLVNICRASGDELRLDILRVLRRDSFGVQELAFIFSMPQPGMSHHLKILATSGLVETKRQGNSIFYRRPLVTEAMAFHKLYRSIFDAVDSLLIEKTLLTRVEKIYKDRSRQSKTFFEKHAKEIIDRQRELCDLSQYINNLRELLNFANLPVCSSVMEVGPGQGLFLKELAARFQNVVALDNSDEMLALAKKEMTSTTNIEFVNSSLETYSPKNGLFDAIVLNMVLHHTPSPDGFFKELSARLKPGGVLLVADLCAHTQNWTKETCGDLWLGFEPEELVMWANETALNEKQSLYLGLKNGFQVQLKLFQKVST